MNLLEYLTNGFLLCDSLVEIITAKKNKIEKTDETKKKVIDYNTPGIVGSLGSVSQYAKAQGNSRSKAQKELEKNLAHTLHKQLKVIQLISFLGKPSELHIGFTGCLAEV